MAGSCPMCDAPLCAICGGCDDSCDTCECYEGTEVLGLDETLEDQEKEAE